MNIMNVVKRLIGIEGLLLAGMGVYGLCKIQSGSVVNTLDPTNVMTFIFALLSIVGVNIYAIYRLDRKTENVE